MTEKQQVIEAMCKELSLMYGVYTNIKEMRDIATKFGVRKNILQTMTGMSVIDKKITAGKNVMCWIFNGDINALATNVVQLYESEYGISPLKSDVGKPRKTTEPKRLVGRELIKSCSINGVIKTDVGMLLTFGFSDNGLIRTSKSDLNTISLRQYGL